MIMQAQAARYVFSFDRPAKIGQFGDTEFNLSLSGDTLWLQLPTQEV